MMMMMMMMMTTTSGHYCAGLLAWWMLKGDACPTVATQLRRKTSSHSWKLLPLEFQCGVNGAEQTTRRFAMEAKDLPTLIYIYTLCAA